MPGKGGTDGYKRSYPFPISSATHLTPAVFAGRSSGAGGPSKNPVRPVVVLVSGRPRDHEHPRGFSNDMSECSSRWEHIVGGLASGGELCSAETGPGKQMLGQR